MSVAMFKWRSNTDIVTLIGSDIKMKEISHSDETFHFVAVFEITFELVWLNQTEMIRLKYLFVRLFQL